MGGIRMSGHTENDRDKEKLEKRCDARGDGIEEAWVVINILHMAVMDRGESWPRALEWLNQWADFGLPRGETNQGRGRGYE
jgi:hypothetical protein